MDRTSLRFKEESKTLDVMLGIYCRDEHGQKGGLCLSCEDLLGYALSKLERCGYDEDKPPCSQCPVHCYKPDMRERIRQVMRYAGPRMIWTHPVLTVKHLMRRKSHAKTSGL